MRQLKDYHSISVFPRRHPEQSEGSLPQFLGMDKGSSFYVAVATKKGYGIAKEETRSFAMLQDDATS